MRPGIGEWRRRTRGTERGLFARLQLPRAKQAFPHTAFSPPSSPFPVTPHLAVDSIMNALTSTGGRVAFLALMVSKKWRRRRAVARREKKLWLKRRSLALESARAPEPRVGLAPPMPAAQA